MNIRRRLLARQQARWAGRCIPRLVFTTGPIARAVMSVTRLQLLAEDAGAVACFSAWWIYYCRPLKRAEHPHEMTRFREERILTPRQQAIWADRRRAITRARERLAA